MKPIIIVDLEATCSENRDIVNEIIEIGAVKIENGKITSTFNSFIRPILNPILTDFCKNLTTINQSDVDNARKFPEVLKDFKAWIGTDDFILMSWGFYDKNQFAKDCNLHRLSSSWIKEHKNIKLLFSDKTGCKPCGMEKALNILHIPLEGTHHRGIDDAKNIAKIYLKIKEV
jgi:inhibitor of KinA sporulation pathway (predicted exonuclease)